ncbi:hypothetical protein ACIBEA_00555 [Streptomyces sp. NPDC051555]|uniref:hypothetical protein n=1 Tax=Streptomyces sp. NPDC051555 TaxID=3365657 RepID=UPI0037A3AE7D
MMRRLPLSLRMWSGALLVCALLLCLAGLARPAMAMSGPMGAAAMSAAPSGHRAAAEAGQQMAADSAGHGTHCPMTQSQCAAPKATIAPDAPAAPLLADVPLAVTCPVLATVVLPNAPPSALHPPDLHRLCVSRT